MTDTASDLQLVIGLDNDNERTQILMPNGWHVAYIEHDPHQAIAQRICDCVNVLADIEDVAEFVKRAKELKQ